MQIKLWWRETIQRINRFMQLVGWGVTLGILGGIIAFLLQGHIIDYVFASEEYEQVIVVEEPEVVEKIVLIEAVTNWTPERIIQEIRETFPEMPNTAVAIAKCESGLIADIQSHHILSYGREQSFGIMQIHAKSWHQVAINLGYNEYKTDVSDNLKMARYIFDKAGGEFTDWTCYNKGLYKKYL